MSQKRSDSSAASADESGEVRACEIRAVKIFRKSDHRRDFNVTLVVIAVGARRQLPAGSHYVYRKNNSDPKGIDRKHE